MTRRGMKPTGIAIFEAQQKGFPSVAHFLQVHFAYLSCSQVSKSCLAQISLVFCGVV
jgi:hypothetical protein